MSNLAFRRVHGDCEDICTGAVVCNSECEESPHSVVRWHVITESGSAEAALPIHGCLIQSSADPV
jgi:hypothetical protein